VKCTHFLPPSWRAPAPLNVLAGGCGGVRRAELCQHFELVRSEFLRNYFIHRIQALAEELLGVILTPLLLIFYLPQAAPDIVAIIEQARHASPNLGDWCIFGCLDPSRNGSEFYGGLPARPGASSTGGQTSREGRGPLVSSGGKLEKSLISFVLAHHLPWSHHEGEEPGIGLPMLCGHATPKSSGASTRAVGPGDLPQSWACATGLSYMQGSFSRAVGSAAGQAAIPMREMASSSTTWMSDSLIALDAEPGGGGGDACSRGIPVWGYPACALQLLHDLEEFQQRESGSPSPHRRLFDLLPEDLLCLERAVPEPQGALRRPAQAPRWPVDDEAGRSSCSSHFFWLEVLYDFHSGRHAAHLGDAVHDGEEAVFEMLEREPGAGQA